MVWLSWTEWLVTNRGSLPACRRSVVIYPSTNRAGVEYNFVDRNQRATIKPSRHKCVAQVGCCIDDRLRRFPALHGHLPRLGRHARRAVSPSLSVVHQAPVDVGGRRRRPVGERRPAERRRGRRVVDARVTVAAARSRRQTARTHRETAQPRRLRGAAGTTPPSRYDKFSK